MSIEYKWYAIQVKPGSENAALKMMENEMNSCEEMRECVEEIFFPVHSDPNNKKKSKVKLVPGYLFVRINMNDSFRKHILRSDLIKRFIQDENGPKVIPDAEIEKIKGSVDDLHLNHDVSLSIQSGDEVKIVDGPFQSFVGRVDYVDSEKKMVRVLILIFGRATPVDLEMQKVEKVG